MAEVVILLTDDIILQTSAVSWSDQLCWEVFGDHQSPTFAYPQQQIQND